MIRNNIYVIKYWIFTHYFFLIALSKTIQDEFGSTALMTASQQGHINCATVLLKHKANVNYQIKVRLLYVHGQHGWVSKNGVAQNVGKYCQPLTAHCTG